MQVASLEVVVVPHSDRDFESGKKPPQTYAPDVDPQCTSGE